MTSTEFNSEINKFSQFIQKMATDLFNDNEVLYPIGFALVAPKEGESSYQIATLILPDGEEFSTSEGRAAIADAIRENNDVLKPMAIALINEGWALELHANSEEAKDLMAGKKAVSEHLDKKEVLMVSVETYASEGLLFMEIDRTEEKPKLILKQDFKWEKKVEGRVSGNFQNLVQKCYVDIEPTIGN